MSSPTFVWGILDSATIIASINSAYDEVVHWRRNIFPVPSGDVGVKFVTELSRLFRAYAERSALECIAMKAITIASHLLLQKPHHKSKPKDHSFCLERRMKLWNEGNFAELVKEGKTLQQRLPRHSNPRVDEERLARSFSNLMFEGKTKSALQLLSDHAKGGVLHVDDTVPSSDGGSHTVLDELKGKHPSCQPASNTAIVHGLGEPVDIHPVVFDCIDATAIRAAALRTTGAA